MQKIKFHTRTVVLCGLAALITHAARADFDPILLTPGTFNADVIVEKTATPPPFGIYTTAAMDSPATNNRDYVWYEQGYNTNETGLPPAGSTFTSITFSDHSFTMPPSYAANNAVYINNQVTNGSFVLTTPGTYTGLSILNSAGNGPTVINYVIHYADGTSETNTFSALDWFGNANPAWNASGRVRTQSGSFGSVGSDNPRLYQQDIVLGNTTSAVTQIDFTYVSGGRAVLFALSGSTGAEYTPIAVTGFTEDVVIEAAAVKPAALTGFTTVSMDGGTNNTANTWFEKGYFPFNPDAGFAEAGSTITSLSLTDHHYQLPANYAANNAVYVDSNAPTANITFASPQNYSALSFLSATANGTVTNQCIMQYADGTSDTNTFVSRDWFNNTPFAFSANGRINLNDRTLNNVNPRDTSGNNPRLYEAQFALGNINSPVTNVVLKWIGGNGNSRAVIFAVSGTAGGVPPIISGLSPNPLNAYIGSNAVLTAKITGGTEPITYQWQKEVAGVYTDLSDGGSISGVTTTNLTFTGITTADAGNYKLVAVNSISSVASGIGTVRVISGLQDMTAPGDPIAIIVGTTPGGEPVPAAIDDTTSKYLNWDEDAAAPFIGPVGFTVTPAAGSTVVSGLRFYTAGDATGRDPADYALEGSTDGNVWSPISSGALALPDGRNGGGTPIDPFTQNIQEVLFANTVGYTSYRLTFTNVKDNAGSTSMQIGEIEFLGTNSPISPIIVREPGADATVYAGASPRFGIEAAGPKPITYQWSSNNFANIADATNASVTLAPVQAADSGTTFQVVVSNPYGSVTSSIVTLTVIAPPTTTYAQRILTDGPIGYWRLGEGPDERPNNGKIAYDYVGGHNGVYTNADLARPGFDPGDTNTAAEFGYFDATDSLVEEIHGVDFSAPNGSASAFTIETWVNGGEQLFDGGIVTKGAGGAEQFNLDTGGGDFHALRFYVRDAGGGTHGNPSTNTLDGNWHHVVGVCDQPNGNVSLYIDGVLATTATIPTDGGILSTIEPMTIGARKSGSGPFDFQFHGILDEVAVYPYALTPEQITTHFNKGLSATLTITKTGPTTIVLSWQTALGAALQSKTELGSGEWQVVNDPVTTVGDQSQVTLSTAGGAQFFRLAIPQ